jgi:catechol 2,3-dioxygenase-like lactoylglutathione lyase family enzyme
LKLNHLNLTVTDVLAACAFLEKYYGLRRMGGNAGMSFMTDDDGFILSIMKAGKDTKIAYPGNFHIGFFIDSEEKVDEIHRRLREDGYEVTTPERHHGYTFYAQAPGGFTVELGA